MNTASQYSGKYSKDTTECVQCSGKKAVKLLGDTSSIKVDCNGNALSINRCDAACGADAACDGKTPGTCSSEGGYICDSNCNKVSSSSCITCHYENLVGSGPYTETCVSPSGTLADACPITKIH